MSKVPTFAKAKDCSEQKEHLSELKEMPIPNGAANCLFGCTFVMTGTLPALTRAKAKKLIEDYGGNVSSSINKKTNVILKGYDEETSKKLQEAEKKGITITDQEGLFNYIASTNPNNNNNNKIQEENDDDNDDNDDDAPESDQSNNIVIPEIKEYIDKKCDLQTQFLNYIDDSENVEENYQIFNQSIVNQNISNSKSELTNLLRLISKVCKNHFHFPNFFSKIEKVLSIFTNEIKQYYLNNELFKIFKGNKRILLFLFQNELLKFDEKIVKKMISYKYIKSKYPQYFAPEIQPFINEEWFPRSSNNKWVDDLKKELPDGFYEKRKIGENDDEICKLIQKDLVKEFIAYVNKENINVNSNIKSSIYETNAFLQKKNKIKLIQYAIFYGSIQIFNYLLVNNVALDPSLWIYAVHGQNAEIIHILEENKIELESKIEEEDKDECKYDEEKEPFITYEDCFFEAIKCHHNDVANYIMANLLQDDETNSLKYISYYLRYHNLSFNRSCVINDSSLCSLCKYNYYYIIKILLKYKDVNVNKKEIFNTFFNSVF